MKILFFAHTPPPHHGQSFMVKLLLDGLKTGEIECFHVNCRVSDDMEDIGSVRFGKLWLLLRYCLQAVWLRFRHGVRAFYYVPAPGKRFALYRDWMVMCLCRPFFPKLILHWHASGLGDWLARHGTFPERWITHALLGRAALSITLAATSSRDALWFHARNLAIVPNGLPDPCPAFETEILPVRKARLAQPGRVLKVLYLAHCTREKGLFDTLEGVALLNGRMRVECTIAGSFMDAAEENAFHERIARPDLAGAVRYVGFVTGKEKAEYLKESDCLCFPTYYPAESFPLTLVEAAAFGLPSVATRWRAIPEIQPPDYPGFVPPQAPAQIADALERLAATDLTEPLRARFLSHFSLEAHLRSMAEAFKAI